VSWEQSTDAADISLEPAAPSHPTGVFPAETAETQAAVVLPTAPLLDGHGGEDVQAQLPKAEEELPSAADTQLPGDHPDESKKSMGAPSEEPPAPAIAIPSPGGDVPDTLKGTDAPSEKSSSLVPDPSPDRPEAVPTEEKAAEGPGDVHLDIGESMPMPAQDRELYDLLKVEPDATEDVLRGAYKRRALELHPDKGGNEEDFKAMKGAYDVLTDPEKRTVYDQHGKEGLRQLEMARQMEANGFFSPIQWLLSLSSGKRQVLALLVVLVAMFFMLPFVLTTLKWDGTAGFHWAIVLIPVWLLQLPICFLQQCVVPEPPQGDEEEWGEDERTKFTQQKKEHHWLRFEGFVFSGLLLLFQLLLLLRLEDDISVSWFVVMLPWILLEVWWVVLKVMVAPVQWTRADAMAAAEALVNTGTVWKSLKFWCFLLSFVQLGAMRLVAVLLLAECADSGNTSWWIAPVPLYVAAAFSIIKAAVDACGSSPQPNSGPAMVATSLSVAAWLTMVLLAVGKLDGGSYSAGLVFSPIFAVFGLVTCCFCSVVGWCPRDQLETAAKQVGETIGRSAETE